MKTPLPRYLESAIREDMPERMVFIGGPRQVGKTTLTRQLAAGEARAACLNWDRREHRLALLRGHLPADADLLVFDELHKYPRWKTWIKGLWDTRPPGQRILVTGSSRLDIFRRGGDSLLGRYRYYALYPFTAREVADPGADGPPFAAKPPLLEFPAKPPVDLSDLLKLGGFPEPLLAGSERTLKRWQRERFERVFREDIRDTEPVRSLAQVELLGALLPERVAAPLSMQSLAEDIEASPKTIRAWMELLGRNYYAFRVPPWHKHLARALKKEAKYYLWDWSEVPDEGARFENLMAVHLAKWCQYQRDRHGIACDLYYVRDATGREADFLVTWERKPWMLVECKRSGAEGLRVLSGFASRLGVRQVFLVVLSGGMDYEDRGTGVRVIPAGRFLMALL